MIANAQFVLTFKVCFLPSIGQFLMSIFYTLYVVLSFIIEYCVAFSFSFKNNKHTNISSNEPLTDIRHK
jgi:ABC-type uncharacterized transport system permease subunit